MVILQRLKSLLNQQFANFLSHILPDRTKRLLLFASLAARQENTRFDQSTVHKLNAIMALSEQDKALNLPIHLSKVIWRGDRGSRVLYSLDQGMADVPVETRVEQIIAEVPVWLQYRNTKGLREDLRRLLSTQGELTGMT